MNKATVQQIEKFLNLANKDSYMRKHAAKLINKLGGIDLFQVNNMISNLERINNKEE